MSIKAIINSIPQSGEAEIMPCALFQISARILPEDRTAEYMLGDENGCFITDEYGCFILADRS